MPPRSRRPQLHPPPPLPPPQAPAPPGPAPPRGFARLPGSDLAPYESPDNLLGFGASCAVYAGTWPPGNGLPVAIKVLQVPGLGMAPGGGITTGGGGGGGGGGGAAAAAFDAELNALSRLVAGSPFCVRLYGACVPSDACNALGALGAAGGTPGGAAKHALVMEMLEGGSLEAHLRPRGGRGGAAANAAGADPAPAPATAPAAASAAAAAAAPLPLPLPLPLLPEDAAVGVVEDVIQGLLYLHDTLHMAHLDLKPGNVLLRRRGAPFDAPGPVVLADFGLAKVKVGGEACFPAFAGRRHWGDPSKASRMP